MTMKNNMRAIFGMTVLACLFAIIGGAGRAEEPVAIAITIKDHQFEPAELHAPAGKPITLTVKNLNSVAAEFESETLHVEKVIAPGRDGAVRVRPLEPGRYDFFDDFHRATKGVLVVP